MTVKLKNLNLTEQHLVDVTTTELNDTALSSYVQYTNVIERLT
ncbi:MAG: hypothetical protein RLZZ135_1721 [Cyanobacteriota bacterium]|jgi:hypothetical protein